jgi:hypothetical protein
MKRHNAFVVKFLKQYEQVCPGIIDSWYAKDIQEKFNSFKSKKCCAHECISTDGVYAQKPTSFILYCMDKRGELQEQNPHVPNKQITAMLAKEWKIHKQLAQEATVSSDNIYNKYKQRYEKTKFFDKHRDTVKEKYPELNEQEIEMTLDKLYMKCTQK